MKKKTVFLVVTLVLVVGAYVGYKYLYKDHRNIAEETAVFNGSAEEIQGQFASGQEELLNQTVIVTGSVSQVEGTSITLDDKVQCVFAETMEVAIGTEIKVKGRCIGYDDLFEIVKLDQSQLIN
ncbi:hypothetical protein POV27_06260 [Aureisphaera galaxeae]|uniref:hypothetical protein n=1 Tax=Aureisphaera galaxeae TaxID=1538023 RepID=UPI0023500FA1|nr:hypothetical protein [Aureisphaera galaxeae]MDC8003647.1 hypothetical protein [Aureisphaera galaxeae]